GNAQEDWVTLGAVLEHVRHGLAALGQSIRSEVWMDVERDRRLDNEVILKLESEVRVVARTHYFVKLLSRSNTHYALFDARRNRFGKIGNLRRWNLRHEGLASVHSLEALQYESYALRQGDPESGHPWVRNGDLSRPFGHQPPKVRHY